jgi:hypothetical protein
MWSPAGDCDKVGSNPVLRKERKKNNKQINNAYSLICYVGENTCVKMHKY